MRKFSANLGFLWQEIPIDDAIRAAARAGFDAVECHWPFNYSSADVREALALTQLPLLSLNTWAGDRSKGDFGLCALPGRQDEAVAAIDEAVSYAADVNCRHVHVMAGITDGSAAADHVFKKHLEYACSRAEKHGIGILIEPINQRDVPGYHLSTLDHAIDIIQAVDRPNLKLMFDCYHIEITHGDLMRRLQQALAYIGHVQIAAVPDRGEPDSGDVDYVKILSVLDAIGYEGYVGAEYQPRLTTNAGLGWIDLLK